MGDGRQARALSVRVAGVQDRGIRATVKLEERNLVAAGAAWNGHRVWVAPCAARDVKSAGHGGKGGDSLGEIVVTGQDTAETAALGFARGIDARCVDAVVALDVVENFISVA